MSAISTNPSVSIVFDLINRSFSFQQKEVRIVVHEGNPWFCGKDVATVLGYINTKQALIDNVREKNKTSLEKLTKGHPEIPLKGNLKNSLYINEPGLYELIMKSKLQVAQQFQDWVFEEVLPGIRKAGQDKYIQQLEEERKLRIQNEQKLNRLHIFNQELLTYKRLVSRDETIYIVSTFEYARQGIFKVGRTKVMTARNSSHNTSHVSGDKVKVLAEFKVNNSSLVEKNIHQKLAGLRPSPNDEHFLCPFNLLHDIVAAIVDSDASQCEAVNRLIDTVAKLRVEEFVQDNWTLGLDMSIFSDKLCIVAGDQKVDIEDITGWSEEKVREEVDMIFKCYKERKKLSALAGQTIEWRDLAEIIKEIYKKPRMTIWRTAFKTDISKRDERLRIKGLKM